MRLQRDKVIRNKDKKNKSKKATINRRIKAIKESQTKRHQSKNSLKKSGTLFYS